MTGRTLSLTSRTLIRIAVFVLAGIALQTFRDALPVQFGRLDVLWVSIAAAYFLAIGISQTVIPSGLRWALTAVSLLCGLLAWMRLRYPFHTDSAVRYVATPFAVTHVAIVSLTVAACCHIFRHAAPVVVTERPGLTPRTLLLLACPALTAALVLPLAYAHVIARDVQESVEEAVQSERYGHAQQLLETILATNPSGRIFDVAVVDVAQMLDERVRSLEKVVSASLERAAGSAEIGERVVALMQLDRNEEALALLMSISERSGSMPVALDYCGLCCQRMRRWKDSRTWYLRSQEFWKDRAESSQRTQALLSACKGIAFAERKLDRPAEAENAYREALAVAPVAEIHFLLARYYEDHQRTQQSAHHARQAMLLSPSAYRSAGRELIDRLSHSHFGCLQIRQ